MKLKKHFVFLKTMANVAKVIAKVRLMKKLTAKEELIYCIQVKGMTKEAAKRFIKK